MAKEHPNIQLLLVGSGQTEWDVAGRVAGSSDLPLAAHAPEEIANVIGSVEGDHPTLVLHAPDEASKATGEQLARAWSGKARSIGGLSEMELGLWEGLLESELGEKFPKKYKQWCEDPTGVLVPEGESVEEASDRVISELCKAIDKSKATSVAVVLRPVANGLVRCWLTGAELSKLWDNVDATARAERHELTRQSLKDGKTKSRTSA